MSTHPVGSPCINVCRIDEATGWCAGCLRTLDEIAWWSSMEDSEKRAVARAQPTRRVQWRRQHPPAAGDKSGSPS
jgi:uncharacterized protein